LLGALPFLAAAPAWPQGQPADIAAASDLRFALDDIAAAFQAATGHRLRITYGSSGNLTQQLLRGAPYQMFFSADEGHVFQLAAAGRTLDQGALYAEGRIVLFAPHDSPLKVDEGLAGLRAALAAGRIRRFAIANPEHAPYGRAAQQALMAQGLWEAVRPALVYGENVSQAAQFATTGGAQGGIIAYSLALVPAVGTLGRFLLIPADLHAALRQRMVLMRDAGPAARAFQAYVLTPPARRVLRRNGFAFPDEVV
jgi:molybdate transport system substrate-binding protein